MLNFFDENPAYENHVLFTDGSGQSVTYQDWYAHSKKFREDFFLSKQTTSGYHLPQYHRISFIVSLLPAKSNRPFTNRSRYGCGTAPAVIIYL